MQNFARALILAPDWSESRIRTGAGIVKGLTTHITDPAYWPYRIFARNLIGTVVLANLANKALTGHFMFQNDPGNTFNIQLGYAKSGKKRYLKIFGTANDFVRIPYDVAYSLAKGDSDSVFRVVRNRLSPIAGQVMTQFTKVNYRGQKIYNPDDPLWKQIVARGGELAGVLFPAYLANPVRYLAGSGEMASEEEVAVSSLELPVRYYGGAYTKTQKEVASITGKTGEELYKEMDLLRGESPLGKTQIEALKQGAVNVGDIIKLRQLKRTANEQKKALLGGEKASGIEVLAAEDSSMVSGDTYYYIEDGSVKSLNIDFSMPELKTSNQKILQDEYTSDFKSELTSLKNRAMTAFDLGLMNQEEVLNILTSVQSMRNALKAPAKAKKPRAVTFVPLKFGTTKRVTGLTKTKAKRVSLVRPKKLAQVKL